MPAVIPLIVAGVTAGSSIAAAKMSSNASKNAANAQVSATNHAADLSAKGNADALAYQTHQSDITNAQHAATEKANYDQWAYRQNGLNDLGSAIGLPNRPIPGYVPTNLGSAASGGQPPTSGAPGAPGGGSASAFIKGLLDKGMDPQQAVQQTNQQLGLKTGGEAVYYDPSQHGGVATIGLPDAYLALTNGQWNLTPRSGGGGASMGAGQPQSLGAAVLQARPNASPMVTPSPLAPPPMNFGRALGAY